MTSKIVVDTSILVKWFNQTDEKNLEKADKIMDAVLSGETELILPELSKYELGNVLLKKKQLTPDQAYISLETAYALPITFVSETEEQARNTYKTAFNLGITYYDASFISLAKQVGATLVTENVKHQGKTKDINVISLENYS